MPENPLYFAPLRVPIVDPRTNLMAREWYLFFQGLWQRTGGANPTNLDDLLVTPTDSSGNAETSARIYDLAAALALAGPARVDVLIPDAILAELSGLRDQVAELTKRLEDLQKGTLL
jgi:hypothetical protein